MGEVILIVKKPGKKREMGKIVLIIQRLQKA